MCRLNMRVERLEATTGKGVPNAIIVFSGEEAETAREVLGPDGILMYIQFNFTPNREVVPYDYEGTDFAWRILQPKFLRERELQS